MYKICIILSLFLLAIIKIIFRAKTIKKVKSGKLVPLGYKLFYSDEKTNSKKESVTYSKLLYSEKYNIQGKPDFIFKKGNKYIPIELKSGKIKNKKTPNKGDLLQLVTYFLIIEDVYNSKPIYGKIVYSDYSFIIKNKRHLKKLVLKTLKDMRLMLKTGKGKPVNTFQKCKHCLCRLTVCEYCNNNK